MARIRKAKRDGVVVLMLGSRWRLGTFLSILSILLLVAGFYLSRSLPSRSLTDSAAEVLLGAGISLFSMVSLLLFENIFDRIRAQDVEVEHGLDQSELVERVRNCRSQIRIFTTWAQLFCRSTKLKDGVFEDLVLAIRELKEHKRPVEMEIILVDPRQASTRQRARELANYYPAFAENYECVTELLKITKGSSITVRARFYRGLPPFSYYQVDEYVNVGFFHYREDASNVPRIVYRRKPAARQVKRVFKWLVSHPDASVDFADQEVAKRIDKIRARTVGERRRVSVAG